MLSTNGSAEHYWPNIKKAILQNPAGQPNDQRMKPQCPVCFDIFDITTFSRPSGNPPTCVVLFCGHVMCRGCLGQTERHNSEDAEKKCPCCRTPLACIQCGEASKTFAVPDANTTPDSVFDAPLTKPENSNTNVQPKCHRCAAGGEWLDRIDNGEYPGEAATIEPGAVRLFYGTVDALESEGRPVTLGSVSSAIVSVTNDEYQMLTSHRNDFMSQRGPELERENPWFGSNFGRDRHGSSSHRHEYRREINIHDYRDPVDSPSRRHEYRRETNIHDYRDPVDSPSRRHEYRRETNIHDYRDPVDSPLDSQAQFRLREYMDYQASLDPPQDAEAQVRQREFEERRRIHDRIPEETSLQDQLSSLSLGGGQRPDRFGGGQRLDTFGRPHHGDERGHARHGFDESRFDERPRRDIDRANYDDFGGGRDTNRDTFSRAQYERDTGNRYSDQYERDTGNRYSDQYGRDTGNRYSNQYGRDTGNGTPHARNTGNPFNGTQYGGDADRAGRFQRETRPDPFAGMSTREIEQAVSHRQYERFVSQRNELQSNELLAEFERNPEAQQIYREETVLGDWTDEDRADPLFIQWRKEIAVRHALWDASIRGDGPSDRRRR